MRKKQLLILKISVILYKENAIFYIYLQRGFAIIKLLKHTRRGHDEQTEI